VDWLVFHTIIILEIHSKNLVESFLSKFKGMQRQAMQMTGIKVMRLPRKKGLVAERK
jgi:hypothetical protein